MGDQVTSSNYTPRQRTRYRERLQHDLEVFDRHLQRAEFISQGTIGLELELNLVDQDMAPAPVGQKVLDGLSEDYQSEIGACNVELNLPPTSIEGSGLEEMQRELERRLAAVHEQATAQGAAVAMVGTLPTLTTQYLSTPGWMTSENRYRALNNSIMQSRGELVRIDIAGQEHYLHDFEDISPESACTSMQLHLQIAPDRFADAWNAAQAIAAVQVALGANSPLFAGHQLWHESRIPLFQQSIDTRTQELVNQGVRPRVWFGERWITSVFDLFEENVRYFSPLLPEDRQDAGTPMMDGESPALHYLNLQNGTIWRWNRPIYDPSQEQAHIRLENRLLPAGPTPVDIVADAAFFYGMVKYLSNQNRPVWSRLSFEAATKNFFSAARQGLGATLQWPVLGEVSVRELVAEHLLGQARQGLEALGVAEELIERYLGVIKGRVSTGQNGATWQLHALAQQPPTEPETPERTAAVATVLRRYLELQSTGEPVHTWSL
ncbi:glutamate--cysteine ligase [Corynebacterium sp. 153RC1]|uniref:glutamate--cysteine ligase n=1 Tax=unclassified Corynebacterium TaxID=2624378 RepID=UPI00211C5EAD|nr:MULTISPECIES: glutamate--cysteine ligase [unclassified Corynebacterium]MCQ9371743.1 glutamate--cysteine ligase [Corynebacterium sp. 35RC1]MCQ9353383.1 glutamate--cysteine ligase [Corynebacterium sp. 209RC1]MCQ9355656.1 glutamate--cysteine ligase [Corynebacterium sp. 1222RC1]MCQ9357849.1 glutamate--cysteine ligase [Corynebacterium sp. 122RC1]MCQ9360033.1 glutamate--cysteine ligase [Corynebacterium sp. 142RC1]